MEKINNIIKTLFYIFILFFIINCQNRKDNFYNSVNSYYSSCKEKKKCYFNLKDCFVFEWDKLYIFNSENYPEADKEEISKIIGIEYNNTRSNQESLLIFIKNNKIVFEIKDSYNFNNISPYLYVDFPNLKDRYIVPSNSKFKISKRDDGGYLLFKEE